MKDDLCLCNNTSIRSNLCPVNCARKRPMITGSVEDNITAAVDEVRLFYLADIKAKIAAIVMYILIWI